MFTAKWCGNCQVVKSMIDLKEIGVEEIDVDSLEGTTLAEEYGVMSLPTFINGKERLTGAQPKDVLVDFFNG